MKAVSLDQSGDDAARWLHFLSRWALATALMILALWVVYLGGVGITASDTARGVEYADLFQAVRSPVLYRVAMVFDALGWLLIGGTLLTLATILKSRAPIRAVLLAACGIAQVVGSLGGFLRLVGISALAAQYAVAAPGQQAALLPSAFTLLEIINAHFVAGGALQGTGYLLVASVMFTPRAFPRWLAGWFVVAGILEMLNTTANAVGAFSFPIFVLTIFIGVVGLHAAIAVAFWRPSSALVSATASA